MGIKGPWKFSEDLQRIDISYDESIPDLNPAAINDMYDALWEAVELSDRTLPPSGRTAECQRVYDLCRAALKRAEGE
ncbi:MAG: hypothetical protein [Bacteriophage sp.]|nr:MAG: hypothetical protein [Bacteriophage sp.]